MSDVMVQFTELQPIANDDRVLFTVIGGVEINTMVALCNALPKGTFLRNGPTATMDGETKTTMEFVEVVK